MPMMFPLALLRHAAVFLVVLLAAAIASANPAKKALDRDRAEDPFKVPDALYTEDISFLWNPRFQTASLGSPDRVVAEAGSLRITERQLFTFLLAEGSPFPLLTDTLMGATAADKAALRQELELAVTSYVVTERLAARESGALDDLDRKQVEILTLPAYQVAFVLRELEPKLLLGETDAVRVYRTEENAFYRKPEATVRVVATTFPFPTPPTPEELDNLSSEEREKRVKAWRDAFNEAQEDAIQRLNPIRERVAKGELTLDAAAELAGQGQPAVSPKSRLVAPGALAPQLDAAVFNTPAGQPTQVIGLPNGAAFAVVESLRPERFLSYDEARPLAYELARRIAARFSFERRFRFVSPYQQHTRTRVWDREEGDAKIIDIDGLTLTKRELMALYPEVEKTERLELDEALVDIVPRAIGMGLVVRREAKTLGLDSDPLIAETRASAEKIVRARKALRGLLRQAVAPTAEQTQAFHDGNPLLFTPAPRHRLVQVYVESRPEVPNADRAEIGRQLLESYIQTCRLQATRESINLIDPDDQALIDAARQTGLLDAPRFREGEGEPYNLDDKRAIPAFPFAPLLAYFRTPQAEVRILPTDDVFIAETPGLLQHIGETPVGDFTPVRTESGVAVAYFVLGIEQPAALPYSQIAPYVTRELARAQRATVLATLADLHAGEGKVRILAGE